MSSNLQRVLQNFRSEIRIFYRPRCLAGVSRLPYRRLHSHAHEPVDQTPAVNIPQTGALEQSLNRDPSSRLADLPTSCPGCGALSQTEHAADAGFYNIHGRRIKDFCSQLKEQAIIQTALKNATSQALAALRHTQTAELEPGMLSEPYCERCHQLQHHGSAVAIEHPTLHAIEAIMAESAHKKNHIWHVVDAADFPLSLVMNLDQRLNAATLRSRNRRARDTKYHHDQEVSMSFVITRSDLFAPTKAQVDALVPKLREILRLRLQAEGRSIRLGNVHVVSADRGWWTRSVKDKIIHESGAHWLIGKVNVGKSNLFNSVYPKGTNAHHDANKHPQTSSIDETSNFSDTFSLLPPPQPLRQYPLMPIINQLPGTTASPIRIRFKNGAGELIDLPGLERSQLAQHVVPAERKRLLMTKRAKPDRIVIKPGKSLLLGGIIRIKPTSPDVIVMAHSFTPLSTHLTSATKAETIQSGELEANVPSILDPASRAHLKCAGTFYLKDDVTRTYAGPLTRRDAGKLKPEQLPFTIFATDILIEGVGWVELIAQVRKSKNNMPSTTTHDVSSSASKSLQLLERTASQQRMLPEFPKVEIWSPEGKYIGQRSTICAFDLSEPPKKAIHARPRRSMRSIKLQSKARQSNK